MSAGARRAITSWIVKYMSGLEGAASLSCFPTAQKIRFAALIAPRITPERLLADQTLEPTERRCGRGPWLQLFTPAPFEWNVYDLSVARLPPAMDGFRIVHLSDVHLRTRWSAAYDRLFEILRANPPDILLFG